MKKKILSVALVVIIALVAVAGASLAFLTDKDEATNTFTIGNVDIRILESTLHRQNDNASDDAIIADAANYSKYLDENGKDMVPGRWVKKAPYVQNIGRNDAYVRVKVILPTAVFDKISIMLYTTGQNDTEKGFTMATTTEGNNTIAVFTFVKALAPNEMTYYAPIWQFKVDDACDNKDLEDLQGYDQVITVVAEAIQAEGFANATEAFAAFEAQNNP